MHTYLALLRGINVGGNSIVPMADLREALAQCGFLNVRTYIQSGNVFFESPSTDKIALAKQIEDCVLQTFGAKASTVVFSKSEWQTIIHSAPKWWGQRDDWKHNLLIVIPPYDMAAVVSAVGELKPDIEAMEAGDGVLYQSMSLQLFGRTTTGKLASNPIYKQLTVRNYNTATKLLTLF